MLLMADLFSLWLCCDCPVDADGASILGDSAMKLRTDTLLAQFQFASPEFTICESLSKHRVEGLSWIVPVEPFPFKTAPLTLTIQAKAVPAARLCDLAGIGGGELAGRT